MDEGTTGHVEARAIVAQLLESGVEIERVWPFWADGGLGGRSRFAPGRHVVAAWPEAVRTAPEDRRTGLALATWLKEELAALEARGHLGVVAMAYETGYHFEPSMGDLQSEPGEAAMPPVVIASYSAWLERDERGPWRLAGASSSLAGARLASAISRAHAAPRTALPPVPEALQRHVPTLEAERGPEVWEAGFRAIQTGLARGDFYQVNLARHLIARLPDGLTGADVAAVAFRLACALSAAQPAAFGALFPVEATRWLVSGSPELLLRWEPSDRVASTWPIKGTLPASADADELSRSEKDKAEHIMIVDLMRNDLGRVAVPGTVEVRDLLAPLGLSTVHHLVSEVRARVRPELDLTDLLVAIHPGGSVTGAPRIAAMRAIDALEPAPRGHYCGTIGLIRPGGEATFSLLIRTALVGAGALRYPVGGGIVVDSDMAREWDETEHKAAAFRRALEKMLS